MGNKNLNSRPSDSDILSVLLSCRRALNVVRRYRVGDTDSYKIASLVDDTIERLRSNQPSILEGAIKEASRALTELDPMGDHHDAAIIDDALQFLKRK